MVNVRKLCGLALVCALALAAATMPRAQEAAPGAEQKTPPSPDAQVLEPLPMPAILKQYQPVTAERLKNPPDGEWPMFRRTYSGWGYSPLTQITTDNVERLTPAWMFSTGVANGHEAAPV